MAFNAPLHLSAPEMLPTAHAHTHVHTHTWTQSMLTHTQTHTHTHTPALLRLHCNLYLSLSFSREQILEKDLIESCECNQTLRQRSLLPKRENAHSCRTQPYTTVLIPPRPLFVKDDKGSNKCIVAWLQCGNSLHIHVNMHGKRSPGVSWVF